MTFSGTTLISWAALTTLTALEKDCVTAVVLKILDKKCRMPTEEQEVMLAIYGLLHDLKGDLFNQEVHECIEEALEQQDLPQTLTERIHQFRLAAERRIPKPVMKAFKSRLRTELFHPMNAPLKIRPANHTNQ